MEKFVVSARKYRPVTFRSVVGQEHITSTLRNAIARKQLAHAYLFCGPRGVGKTTCARIMAKTINCLNPTAEMEPCNECASCKAFNESNSFNIHELDAASNNSVDNMRTLTEQVRILPQVGAYSIYIIDEAHMLSTSAFNAFLKTLEEPPAHAIFILATTEKHKILPTILSRCQIFDFKRIKVEDVVNYLRYISSQEGVTYDDESLHMIAQKADGCMRDALSMYDKVVSFCGSSLTFTEVAGALNVLDYDTYFSFVDTVAAGDYEGALLMLDEVIQKGFDPQSFMSGLASHFRDLLVAHDVRTQPLLEVTGSVAERYKQQSGALSPEFIFNALSIITQAEGTYRFTLNSRLQTELAVLKLAGITGGTNTGVPAPAAPLPAGRGGAATSQAMRAAPAPKPVPAEAPPAPAKPAETTAAPKETPPPAPAVDPVKAEKPLPEREEPERYVPERERAGSAPVVPKAPAPAEQPARPRKSKLGIASLSTLMTPAPEETAPEAEESAPLQQLIPREEEEAVLTACRQFAENIRDKRPRISAAFEKAVIEEGKIKVTVSNKILQDDINKYKVDILRAIDRIYPVKGMDFTVELDETVIEEKLILLRDEERYKYILEQNPAVHTLTTAFELNFE